MTDDQFVREVQRRLGVTADGVAGPRTMAALDKVLPVSRPDTSPDISPVTGLRRIVFHWTAGTYVVSSVDRRHYHFIIAGDGSTVDGVHKPEDNISTTDGHYAAHTRGLNTGSIGVAVAGMNGATERPFSAGGFPMRDIQIEALVRLLAHLCAKYRIPVTPQTVLSHAEVEKTLGVKQSGKIDIMWLPGMNAMGDPIAIGNIIRARVAASR